ETAFLANTAKQIRSLGEGPKSIGRYKVGSPYQIKGVWYYPRVDYGYDESGVASWYGPNFHSKPTANGEVFDQNAVSAAHRTLPLPSVVRVTNLENGRALVVRINDRGPFAHGRIIDMSRRGAQLLGFERRGTARVRVQLLPRESREAAKMAQAGRVPAPVVANANAPDAVPVSSVSVAALTPVPGTTLAPPPETAVEKVTLPAKSAVELTRQSRRSVLQDQPVEPTNLFVQAASFSKQGNASRLKSKLSDVGSASVYGVQVDGKQFYRVRIGPLNDVGMADRVLAQVIARGFPGARIIVARIIVD
ncbi:MAG: septal ring lytic transglycosylase RlpA family protein, partial [Proteobacteria bacterium]|nr:septal ring lytic transglycosylase RlpA family protein [Pseudomonadota bacterium]